VAITLEGITLPDDIQWTDEFVGFGVGQVITPTLTGALVVEETAQVDGRAMTLQSGSGAWLTRGTVEAVEALAATPLSSDGSLALVWGDGRTFDVAFDRSRGPAVEAVEVLRVASGTQTSTHYYTVTLRLLIKG